MAGMPLLVAFKQRREAIRQEAANSIAYANLLIAQRYDAKHKDISFVPGDQVYIKLHHGYSLPKSADTVSKKFEPQRMGPFTVLR